MNGNGAIGFDRRARDAVAVLAHTYMQFDRAREAAALLGALAVVDEDPAWALTARCLALVLAGDDEGAADEASRLLEQPLDDTRRRQVLRILARACWKLGREDEARAHLAALRQLAAVTVLQPPSGSGSRRQ
jgi:Flp pilus assembly protein TadD